MNDRHSPHLTSQKPQAFHNRVGEPVEGDLMWSTGVIRCVRLLLDPLVPVVSVSIQCADTMAIDSDVVASEDERRGLILVANGKGCI